MTSQEAVRFRRDPLFEKHLLLRRIDERAKVVDLSTTDLETWKNMVEAHLPVLLCAK